MRRAFVALLGVTVLLVVGPTGLAVADEETGSAAPVQREDDPAGTTGV